MEKVFHGWPHLLLNAIVGFAADRGFREVRVPTSRLAMEHTDRARTVQTPVFERVYDRAVHQHFRAVEVEGWWAIDVEGQRGAVVPLAPRPVERVPGKTVCVCHDTERGLGHLDVEPGFAREPTHRPTSLEQMLAVERRVGVRATYSVAGSLFAEVRARSRRTATAWRSTPSTTTWSGTSSPRAARSITGSRATVRPSRY